MNLSSETFLRPTLSLWVCIEKLHYSFAGAEELGAIRCQEERTYRFLNLLWCHLHTHTTFLLKVFGINGIQRMTPNIFKSS